MEVALYPAATNELARRRKELAPATHDAFQAFSRQVFTDGALDAKTKLASVAPVGVDTGAGLAVARCRRAGAHMRP
jgi:hypothetical protein